MPRAMAGSELALPSAFLFLSPNWRNSNAEAASRPAGKRKEKAALARNEPRRSPGASSAAGRGRLLSRERSSGSSLFQNAPRRSRRPRPRPGLPPPPASFAWRARPPLPLAGAAPRPRRGGVPSPEPPGAAGSGRTVKPRRRRQAGRARARSGDEAAAPARAGGGGRAASEHFGSPHHGRTDGAAAEGSRGAPAGEWPASQRRAEGGVGVLGRARRSAGRAQQRRPPAGPAGSAAPRGPESSASLAQPRAPGHGSDRSQIYKRLNRRTALAEAGGRGRERWRAGRGRA
ncbi:skin secretory protein xP2-like [Ochotona princeps]|uniref:skin secretory protein xP2-like n=1 Tax=Ochotona princeps TaxID=9978 RepID=UPI0027152CDC|nr:skin secretory protein xP2-like [Ochotona princeps]